MKQPTNRTDRIKSAFLPVILPIIMYAATVLATMLNIDSFNTLMTSEKGIIENITVLFLLMACFYAARAGIRNKISPQSGLRIYIFALALACLMFAGEELSWGQHAFAWRTPDYWTTINKQEETNLHNISGILNETPRMLLTLFAVIAGFVAPVIVKLRNMDLKSESAFWYWYMPPFEGALTAFCAPTVTFHAKIMEKLNPALDLNVTGGETKEALLALFLLIYAKSIATRWAQTSQSNNK
ncbi:MAG: hypothetical protein JXN60_04985 [Lentisphaerae bacterium]|nr:hypothetical protein [Lentisphaerota bacterium]